MSAAGRKRDPVWSCFHQLPAGGIKGLGCRAKCKDCGTELQGLVARMKAHRAKCAGQSDEATASGLSLEAAENSTVAIGPQQAVSDSDDNSAMPSTSSTIDVGTTAATHPGGRIDVPVKTVRLDNFVTKTSKSEKEVFDTQIAKFIYATNSSFRIVEHPDFVRLIELLHPGYSPPSRLDISGRLLDAVHSTCLESSKEMLKGKTSQLSVLLLQHQNRKYFSSIRLTPLERLTPQIISLKLHSNLLIHVRRSLVVRCAVLSQTMQPTSPKCVKT